MHVLVERPTHNHLTAAHAGAEVQRARAQEAVVGVLHELLARLLRSLLDGVGQLKPASVLTLITTRKVLRTCSSNTFDVLLDGSHVVMGIVLLLELLIIVDRFQIVALPRMLCKESKKLDI